MFHPRRNRIVPRASALLLLFLLAVPAASAGLSPAQGKHRASHARAALVEPSVRLFAANSVWNVRPALSAPLDPTSAVLAAGLVAEVAKEQQLGWGPWISTASASTPIYRVGALQPTVFVQLDDPTQTWRAPLQAAFVAVPIPADAEPALGPDAHLTIWQASTDKLWEFWHARKLADGWHAAWGGAIANVSQSPGYYTDSSWLGSRSFWGATGSSLPVAGGTITIAELLQGHIDHALAVNLPYAKAGVFSWPAQRTDGSGTDANMIPEGAQLRLDPNLDLSTLKMSPLVRMMAVAAQRYGMIVRDQTFHAIGFFIEDPRPSGSMSLFYSPTGAISPTGFFAGQYPTQLMAAFPWGSLKVLRMQLRSQ
jgi:hypothetical protein